MNIVETIPIPISGLILALFSLGNLVQDINPYLRYLFGTIAFIFLILIVLKVVFYPKKVRDDLKNQVILSSSGTFSMSLMLSSTYIQPYMPDVACALWIIGICLHILLMICFTYRFIIRDFDINMVYPSYWIVYVGITMAAITGHVYGLDWMDFLFFAIGFTSMLITTPLIFYRYIRHPNRIDANKPLICIFTALFSILIVGYVNSAPYLHYGFLMTLYTLACIFYIFAFYKFIDYRNLEFYPSFSAFTFPFVISALATKEIVKISSNIVFTGILRIETVIALILVIYVLVRYAIFLKNSVSRN